MEEKENLENQTMEANKDSIPIPVEEIKKEASQTVQQVRDTLKTVNIKEDTEKTKGFLKEMLKTPIEKLRSVADNPVPYMKTAVLLMIIWMLAAAARSVSSSVSGLRLSYFFDNILSELFSAFKSGISPLLGIVVLSGIVVVKNKNKSQSLMGIMITLIVAKIPYIFAVVFDILQIFGSSVRKLTNPINSVCYILSIVLTYFALKFLFKDDDDESFIRQFALIYGIYCIAGIVTGLFGLNI